MTASLFIFIIAMFLGIWFTTVNIMLFMARQNISIGNFIIMSASLTAIITHLMGIW